MHDTSFLVPRRNVAAAYRTWQKKLKREVGTNRTARFKALVRQGLNLLGSKDSVGPLPGSTSTWSDWAKEDNKTVRLSYDQCRVIRTITGVDLIPGQGLDEVNDNTSVVTLKGRPRAQKISNSPNEANQELYLVLVERVVFRRSAPMRVSRSWFGTSGEAGEVDVGSAVYGLSRALIALEADGWIEPVVTYLTPQHTSGQSTAIGVVLSVDPQNPGCWTIEPEAEQMLFGEVHLDKLATAWQAQCEEMILTVEAEADWIEVDFRPSGEVSNKDKAKSDARKHLIDKVLRLALSDGGKTLVFSQAAVKAERVS